MFSFGLRVISMEMEVWKSKNEEIAYRISGLLFISATLMGLFYPLWILFVNDFKDTLFTIYGVFGGVVFGYFLCLIVQMLLAYHKELGKQTEKEMHLTIAAIKFQDRLKFNEMIERNRGVILDDTKR